MIYIRKTMMTINYLTTKYTMSSQGIRILYVAVCCCCLVVFVVCGVSPLSSLLLPHTSPSAKPAFLKVLKISMKQFNVAIDHGSAEAAVVRSCGMFLVIFSCTCFFVLS